MPIKEMKCVVEAPELDVPCSNAKEAFDELARRTYDKPAIFGFARAARSWTKKGSPEWNVWLEVEKMTEVSK